MSSYLSPLCYTFLSQTSQSHVDMPPFRLDGYSRPSGFSLKLVILNNTYFSHVSTLTWSPCTPQCLYRLWDDKWGCLFLLSSPWHKWARRHFCEVAFIGFQRCHGYLSTIFISCEIPRTLLESRIENLLYSMQAHRQVKWLFALWKPKLCEYCSVISFGIKSQCKIIL